jgi:hypothetical protein
MALDRTWYNSLVNDDGSGLMGSVWDKEDVNQLMNAIDAEFAVPRGPVWTFAPPNLFCQAGSIVGGSLEAYYSRNNKAVTLAWKLDSFSLTAISSYVGMFLPLACNAASVNFDTIAHCYVANATAQTYVVGNVGNTTQIVFYPNTLAFPGTAFPAGVNIIIRGQMTYMID